MVGMSLGYPVVCYNKGQLLVMQHLVQEVTGRYMWLTTPLPALFLWQLQLLPHISLPLATGSYEEQSR